MTQQSRAADWIKEFAAALGVDAPDEATVEILLELAGVAAHASERLAAPLACYLVGRADANVGGALDLSRTIGHQA